MDCVQCAENLTAYLDAELNATESEEVRLHLQVCASCANELGSFRKAAEYIESRVREIDPNPGTWRVIQARISAEQPARPQFRFFSPRWHLAATMLVVFGIFGLGYMQHRQLEKRSLQSYITKYTQERDARIRAKRVLAAPGDNASFENKYGDNPFVEVNYTPAENPFLLEGR
jgi:anti-sigma factor RsiW